MAERILVLAPRGRDGRVIEGVMQRAGITVQLCDDLPDLHERLQGKVGSALVTEEALAGPALEPLLALCEAQPSWSDIPFIVLATRQIGRRSDAATRVLERLGNVVLLERPVNAETLASAARACLRVRRRQYETRDLLQERERRERELRLLNETLEQRVSERAQELQKTRVALEFALDSAGMGSWDLDLVTDTSRRTPQHDRIFGYATMLPAWGRATFLEHVLEEEREEAAAAFARAAETGVLDIECRIRRPDGAVRWITAKGRAGYDATGRAVRMAGVVMDTTDRRVTEDALHQAQKMEAIGQLTGGVAHDFNNLLTVIVGGLDMVLRRPEQTERVTRLATAAMTAARRGEQLTQQLLAFSRRQMLRPQTLNPNRLLLEFAGLARRAVGEAVTLRFDLDPAVDPIRVDPAQFESAVLNLVVNARDAMPEGGEVTVSSRNVHRDTRATNERGIAPGAYVMVTVTDTGTGIDAPTLLRAFEPFFTTKEVGKGSGLGLSQVYGFARSAGGDVAIDSAVGHGTSVRLYFPPSFDAPAEEPATAPGKVPLRPAASGETVLLVEDDEQVLAMAVESLEELRYNVIVAHNAREALEHIHGPARIDIMFSDVVMPGGMNGAQLAVEARRLRPELKVLLTSGYVGEPLANKPIADDMDVLNKPYRRDELAQKLRVVLGRG
ncbi:hybrid sensor histidine kinase/response regulator [Muricoccus aerilatus]|uniref:hybrid sensor histidine kinase/response regulator n=1 Tax=Muricoccus aerilatus TaxID=452982 RepID=UPI0005C1CFD0|nr:hybrid sensor histidine kinase/response regulator [Roseomonas aerilata]